MLPRKDAEALLGRLVMAIKEGALLVSTRALHDAYLAARAEAVQAMLCPNCHDANACGDYQGPTCETCGGL